MKKLWKKSKWLLITWIFLVLLVFFTFVFFLPCSDQRELANNIIQAIAIITLVLVTLSYAISTMELAEQTRNQSDRTAALIEDQKLSRDLDFREKILEKFCMPLQYRLNNLKSQLEKVRSKEDLPYFTAKVTENSNAITNVFEVYGYLSPEDLSALIGQTSERLGAIINLDPDDEGNLEKLRDQAKLVIEKFLNILLKQSKENTLFLNDHYKFKEI